MSDATQPSGAEAIRQVIEDGGAMDYIDVVNEVQKRFRLEVTSAQVEQVVHDLVTKKPTKVRPGSRVGVDMASNLSGESSQTVETQPKSTPSETQPAQPPTDDLSHALHFVKSVHGLANAKRALAELESILLK